jgi:hypothetical protein
MAVYRERSRPSDIMFVPLIQTADIHARLHKPQVT